MLNTFQQVNEIILFYFYIWNPYTATSVFLNISVVHTHTKTLNIPPFI